MCPVQLRRKSFCEWCVKWGRVISAKVVKHITPHRGNGPLFTFPANHESVCKSCHDGLIQKEEAAGLRIGTTVDGRPIPAVPEINRVGSPIQNSV